MKKIESIAKWYNIDVVNIITVESVLSYIKQNQISENYVCVEITNNSNLYYHNKYDFNKPIWIIVWAERHWISDEVLNLIWDSVHLPMFGTNSSMNVSHAWIVVAYDIIRQYLSNE